MSHDGRAREAGDLRVRLEVLAWTAAQHGHDDLAAHLFGAVAAAAEAVGASRPRIDPRHYEQARAAVRGRLGQTHYAVAWDEGYGMSPDQVLSRATTRGSTASMAGPVDHGGCRAMSILMATSPMPGTNPDARRPMGDPGALPSAGGPS